MGLPDLIAVITEAGFVRLERDGRGWFLAPALSAGTDVLTKLLEPPPEHSIRGNRGSAWEVARANLPPMFVRRFRRGGWMRLLVADLYVGWTPRPFRELALTLQARGRDLPVVEPLGAAVEWVGPMLYRGWLISRALEGATLWEVLAGERDPARRAVALRAAATAIARSHAGGLFHADLNLHNLLLTPAGPAPGAIMLDLDKARLYPPPLATALRQANLRRLARSARKLATAGGALTRSEASLLGIAPD